MAVLKPPLLASKHITADSRHLVTIHILVTFGKVGQK